jgi:hypothetical protein
VVSSSWRENGDKGKRSWEGLTVAVMDDAKCVLSVLRTPPMECLSLFTSPPLCGICPDWDGKDRTVRHRTMASTFLTTK